MGRPQAAPVGRNPRFGDVDRPRAYVSPQMRVILRLPQGGLMGSKTSSRRAVKNRNAKRSRSAAQEEPRALTLKVDGELYDRLLKLRGSQRRTHQDILEQALKEYLTREGV